MKALKILQPESPKKTKLMNFRITEEDRKALAARLEKDGLGPQAFFDQVIRAYLAGKIT